MATTGRTASEPVDAARIASRLREAEFVHLVGRADGAGLAAIGLLADALDSAGIPHQASLAKSPGAATARFVDEGTTLGLGFGVGDRSIPTDSLAGAAYEIASALDAEPDPILAVAGAVAGSNPPAGPAFEAAQEMGVERRPGLGIPVADLAAGLAYSGRIHASFSGDEQAAGAFLAELELPAELDASDQTTLAGAVALEATAMTPAASTQAISDFLAPYDLASGFETVEGYADVLDALAMADPGTGLAFVLGYEDREVALDGWRDFGRRLHRTLDRLSPTETGSVAVAEVESVDPRPVARLLRDFEVAVPIVVVAGQGMTAVATTDEDAVALLGTEFDDDTFAGDSDLAWLHSQIAAETVAERLGVDG